MGSSLEHIPKLKHLKAETENLNLCLHCKLHNLVTLRGQRSNNNGTCESKVACKCSKKCPRAFKSCFDTAKRKIAKNAAHPAKENGFTKQNHIRGDKTLNKH